MRADKTDVTITFVKKNLNKFFTVCRLIFMNCSDVVSGIFCCFIDICTVFFADYTEELCKIYFIIITCLDC